MGSEPDIQPFLTKLGKRIKALRVQQGLTQTDLADRTFMDYRQIQRIEGGHINTSIGNTYLIAQALEVSLSDLVESISADGA
ncbi:MAG: helix-turn-helix transcriptional regulator [Bacteroidota bacterium]